MGFLAAILTPSSNQKLLWLSCPIIVSCSSAQRAEPVKNGKMAQANRQRVHKMPHDYLMFTELKKFHFHLTPVKTTDEQISSNYVLYLQHFWPQISSFHAVHYGTNRPFLT